MAHDFGLVRESFRREAPAPSLTRKRDTTDRLIERVSEEGRRVNPRTDRAAGRNALSLPRGLGRLPDESLLSRNPLGAIGSIVQDSIAGLRGQKGGRTQRLAQGQADADFRRQKLRERSVDIGLKVLDAMNKLSPDLTQQQRQTAVDNLQKMAPFLNLTGMADASPAMIKEAELFGKRVHPSLANIFVDNPRLLFSMKKERKDAILEASDSLTRSDVNGRFRDILKNVGGKLTPSQKRLLADTAITMSDFRAEAEQLGFKPHEVEYIEEHQSELFAQWAKDTGLNFVSGEVLEAGATAGAKTAATLEAKGAAISKILLDAGALPLPTDKSGGETTAITQPFGAKQPASPDAQDATRLLLASRRLFAKGMNAEANTALAQANQILRNSPDIQRERDLDKPISDELSREFQVPPGTTYREVLDKIPRSPEDLAEEKAAAGLRGRNRVKAQQQVGFIGEASGMIRNLIGAIEEDKGIVGIRGGIRRFGQKATGVVTDLTQFARDFAFQNTDLGIDQITDFFENPNLPLIGVMENSIGLILARLRTPEGRVPVDVIQRSIEDVKLTGLEKSEDVVVRLNFVLKMLEGRSERLGEQFGLERPGPAIPELKIDLKGRKLVPVEVQ